MSNEERQTPAELAAQFAAEGPVQFVWDWLNLAVVDGHYDRGWTLLDDTLRLCRAQAWLWNNREHPLLHDVDLETTAEEWVADAPGTDLWRTFCGIERDQLREIWPADEIKTWGAGSRPRIVAPELELVVLVPTQGEVIEVVRETVVDNAKLFYVRAISAGEWRLASFAASRLPEPGWPPSF